MHDDLIDAIDWAIEEGIAARDKIAISGGSYGGYATLVGLTFTPDRFACGVDLVGPSNLVTLIESFPAHWDLESSWYVRVGDPRTDAGRADLLARSPISRVQDIEASLLIMQGANDTRVLQSQSDEIVQTMQQKGLPVTYVVFPDEGHGLRRNENRNAFTAIMEGFLHSCLGGRFEPLGKSLEGSSLHVEAGSERVPGLAQVLEDFDPTVKN